MIRLNFTSITFIYNVLILMNIQRIIADLWGKNVVFYGIKLITFLRCSNYNGCTGARQIQKCFHFQNYCKRLFTPCVFVAP